MIVQRTAIALLSLAGLSACGGGGAVDTTPEVSLDIPASAILAGTTGGDTGGNGLAFADGAHSYADLTGQPMTVRLVRAVRGPLPLH